MKEKEKTMKKEYLKPEMEYIQFYTDEEMTSDDSISGPDTDISGGDDHGWG